jgi:hypothetical protein
MILWLQLPEHGDIDRAAERFLELWGIHYLVAHEEMRKASAENVGRFTLISHTRSQLSPCYLF